MASVSAFQPSSVVVNPENLFGRSRSGALLDQLADQLLMGINTQLLGERRSGKTSLLKCLSIRLRSKSVNLIPIFLDYREHHLVQGYGNAHRLLVAHLHATIVNDEAYNDLGVIQPSGIELSNSPDPMDHYEVLLGHSDYQVGRLLDFYLREHPGSHRYGIALLLDEYEHLMLQTFEGRAGSFFKLRGLSAEPPAMPGSPKPFTYIIAGSTPWPQLCDTIGSPDLNNTSTTLYVHPLDREPFFEMWDFCLANSSPEVRGRVMASSLSSDSIYDLAGGWPFYGKIIGHQLAAGNDDLFGALVQHFSVIWTRLSEESRVCLEYATRGQHVREDAVLSELIRLGLMQTSEVGESKPRGELWSRFIQEVLQTTPDKEKLRYPKSPDANNDIDNQLRLLVENISVLVTEINETNLNYGKGEVFVCSNQDVQIFSGLRQPSLTGNAFTPFALSLYNLVFERTTGSKVTKVVSSSGTQIEEREVSVALERLPKKFRRKHKTVRVIDAARHHFGQGHLTRLPTFNSSGAGMKIDDVLEMYLHSRAHPKDEDFLDLQFGILNDVVSYLQELRDYLRESKA